MKNEEILTKEEIAHFFYFRDKNSSLRTIEYIAKNAHKYDQLADWINEIWIDKKVQEVRANERVLVSKEIFESIESSMNIECNACKRCRDIYAEGQCEAYLKLKQKYLSNHEPSEDSSVKRKKDGEGE